MKQSVAFCLLLALVACPLGAFGCAKKGDGSAGPVKVVDPSKQKEAIMGGTKERLSKGKSGISGPGPKGSGPGAATSGPTR